MYKPTFNPKKFKALALHLSEYIRCNSDLLDGGIIRLSAMLYYCDFERFAKTTGEDIIDKDRTITGSTYVKKEFGIFPKQLVDQIELWKKNGDITIHHSKRFRYDLVDVIPTTQHHRLIEKFVGDGLFNHDELDIVRQIRDEICNLPRNDLMQMMKDERGWIMSDINAMIPYESYMIASPESEWVILWCESTDNKKRYQKK